MTLLMLLKNDPSFHLERIVETSMIMVKEISHMMLEKAIRCALTADVLGTQSTSAMENTSTHWDIHDTLIDLDTTIMDSVQL